MKKPGLKLPKRLKEPSTPAVQPQTAQEYVDQGTTFEESGDRWLGSDLSKALRFFQRAFSLYTDGIKLSKSGYFDAYYNASRLLFHVYTNFTKKDGVNFRLLTNVNDAIDGSQRAVVQPLENIIIAHQTAILFAQQSSVDVPLDLLFNTVLVNTEDIETRNGGDNNDFGTILTDSKYNLDVISQVIDRQTVILKAFVLELQNCQNSTNQSSQIDPVYANSSTSSSSSSSDYTQTQAQEVLGEEVLQPSDLFETILVAFKLIQAICESVGSPEQSQEVLKLIAPYTARFSHVSDELMLTFTADNEFLLPVSSEQVADLQITKTCIQQTFQNDLSALVSAWDSDELPKTPERYMLAADNLQIFLDRNQIDLTVEEDIAILLWATLTKRTNLYKSAIELENQKVQELKKLPSGQLDGLGEVIAQICALYIERADIELQRSQIKTPAAVLSRGALLQNCKNFLKSAINVSATSGGLRERVLEKLARDKRKTEALVRLCIVEGEGECGAEELDIKVGRVKWPAEVEYLKDTGIYTAFGVDSIEIPGEY